MRFMSFSRDWRRKLQTNRAEAISINAGHDLAIAAVFANKQSAYICDPLIASGMGKAWYQQELLKRAT